MSSSEGFAAEATAPPKRPATIVGAAALLSLMAVFQVLVTLLLFLAWKDAIDHGLPGDATLPAVVTLISVGVLGLIFTAVLFTVRGHPAAESLSTTLLVVTLLSAVISWIVTRQPSGIVGVGIISIVSRLLRSASAQAYIRARSR